MSNQAVCVSLSYPFILLLRPLFLQPNVLGPRSLLAVGASFQVFGSGSSCSKNLFDVSLSLVFILSYLSVCLFSLSYMCRDLLEFCLLCICVVCPLCVERSGHIVGGSCSAWRTSWTYSSCNFIIYLSFIFIVHTVNLLCCSILYLTSMSSMSACPFPGVWDIGSH